MTRRFTQTDKWNDEWFLGLSHEAKVLFEYLRDNCDIAGFWQVDYEQASRKTSLPRRGANLLSGSCMTIEDAMEELGAKIIWQEDGAVIYLKNFLKHQGNWPLKDKSTGPYVKGILGCFDSHGAFGRHIWGVLLAQPSRTPVSDLFYSEADPSGKPCATLTKGLPNPLGKGIGKGKRGGVGGKHLCAKKATGLCKGAVIYPHRYREQDYWLCKYHEQESREHVASQGK